MPTPPARTRLAHSRGLFSHSTVFRFAEGLEEQRVEGYDVSFSRVRFDEVLLVTRHRTTNWVSAIAVFFGISAFAMGSLMAGLVAEKAVVGLVALGLTSGPLVVVLLLLLTVKVEVVTVFGQRMRIRMRFWLRKERASRVHDEVCRATRRRQERSRKAVPVVPAAS